MTPIYTALGVVCEWLAGLLTEASRRLIRCPTCGRSRYYGRPCK